MFVELGIFLLGPRSNDPCFTLDKAGRDLAVMDKDLRLNRPGRIGNAPGRATSESRSEKPVSCHPGPLRGPRRPVARVSVSLAT